MALENTLQVIYDTLYSAAGIVGGIGVLVGAILFVAGRIAGGEDAARYMTWAKTSFMAGVICWVVWGGITVIKETAQSTLTLILPLL